MFSSTPISSNWTFKERNLARTITADFAIADGWRDAIVPGCIHTDLLTHGAIPDPFIGTGEKDVQWVGERDWLYQTYFEVDNPDALQNADIVFEGLDTFATVWLNGTQILSNDNMFVPRRIAVRALLRMGQNSLEILFESAWRKGKEAELACGGPLPLWNGDSSRLYVRKASYHYGWDWGPTLLTAGIWRLISLEQYDTRVDTVHGPVQVANDLSRAIVSVDVRLAGSVEAAFVRITLVAPDGSIVTQDVVKADVTTGVHHVVSVDNPKLWWPNGYGKQPLYTLSVELVEPLTGAPVEGSRMDQSLGLRTIKLAQKPVTGETGASFTIEVNNTEIFCGGANWIPADSFLNRLSTERYRAWLEMAANGNMQMVRVWGGGIYEHDAFYDACDQLGLLVWQDFLFACGIYPAHASFLESVRSEAEAAVTRLRHHACLAIWAGNNEDYQIAESNQMYDPGFQGDFLSTKFPAREIYERLLPDVCARLDPGTPYWPGSPWSPDSGTSDQTRGDQHVWSVWHQRMFPYQEYGKLEGRFVTEFGMQSFPNYKTVAEYFPAGDAPMAGSAVSVADREYINWHNKAEGGARRLQHYIHENFGTPGDAPLEEYIYISQLMQAEAMHNAYSQWRMRWGQPGARAVSGALVWQLNDCWPVTSWALVDYYLRPKAAWYVTRRDLADVVVGALRDQSGVSRWIVNGALRGVSAQIESTVIDLDGSIRALRTEDVFLPANATTELNKWTEHINENTVLSQRLLFKGNVIARSTNWPEPFKNLRFDPPMMRVNRLGKDLLEFSVEKPAKGVWLAGAGGLEPVFSDNCLDLIPGDSQIVHARGLGNAPVRARWLGM